MAALATPTIVVNGDVVAIKANSFSWKPGKGDKIVRSQSTGGGASTTVVTTNAETLFSTCKFTVLTTDISADLVLGWQDNLDSNLIEVTDINFAKTFQQAIIINDPDYNLGSEGEIEVEFQARPAV